MDEGTLVPFKRQAIASGVYEAEIEALLWDNLEEITGDNLFRVARQATLPSGGRPDIIALDPSGRVVVIEVKRDVDRNQLAQALEYAGWARGTSLDELARLFHGGGEEHRSPSGAAMAAAEVVSYDGWYAWRVGEGGPTLNELRRKIALTVVSAP
jgi:hypothetical protein